MFSQAMGQNAYKVSEEKFDFGYVGIDYRIFHNYQLINTSKKDIRIDSVDVMCDCSSVLFDKKVLKPHDTVLFKLTFDTRDFYGPVSRKFNVFLSIPEKRVISFFYLAEVGQWQNGLKPDPFAVFMLPTHKQQIIRINNRVFESIEAEVHDQHADFFKVEIVNNKASKAEHLEFAIMPNVGLAKGTYLSNFTIKITAENDANPAYLTIPVKIARF
jgi:hypothetical protein